MNRRFPDPASALARLAIALVMCAGITMSPVVSTVSALAVEPKPYNLKGEVNETNFLSDTETTMGLTVAKARLGDTKGVVSGIKLGSAAAKGGLRVGDKVLEEKIRGTWLEIKIERDGKPYQVTLSEFGMEAIRPRMAPMPPSKELQGIINKLRALEKANHSKLDVGTVDEKTKRELLQQHDVIVMIDKSGSMQTMDCPGGTSRWDWCREQSYRLGQQFDTATGRPISVVLFDSASRQYDNLRLADIQRVFSENKPDGGTLMGLALDRQIDRVLGRSTGRPVVIALITDGGANDGAELAQAVIHASRNMRFAHEITIEFIQVGRDPVGTHWLHTVDNELVGNGARTDIVDVAPFDTVAQQGLRDAIVQAIISTSTGSKR